MLDIDSSFRTDLEEARTLLDNAEAILIGAGAGLSAAAGLLYLDRPTFESWFPGYSERYGLRYIYEAAFFDYPTAEEYYAYWARHIRTIRYRFPAGQPYTDLKSLVAGRRHFVLTTNVDGQFFKAGFDPERVATPQGDYAYFQCSGPCSDELYRNEEMIETMLSGMEPDDFAIRSEDVPHCPKCARLLVPNIRKDAGFVEAPWLPKVDEVQSFLEATKAGPVVLLELGVGFNTPVIIRFPFERIVAARAETHLIRVNRDQAEPHDQSQRSRTLSCAMDAGRFLAAMARRQ